MSAVELMAKAAWVAQHGSRSWERVQQKNEFISYMRQALLALAAMELPEKAIDAGEHEFYVGLGYPSDWMPDDRLGETAFRAIIKALAEEGK